VSRAQVEVDGARAELIRTESQVRIARGDLNAVMGLPAEAPLDVDAGSIAGPSDEPLDVGALIEQAVRVRPEIKAAQSAITAARQHVEAAKGAYGPRVYADGSWGWRADSASLDDEAWFAGVTVELTVFEGFSRRHALKMSEAVAARAEAILDQVRLAVRREVWTACARIQETRELVRATVTQVRDAEESVRLMAARYRAGAVTVTGLLDAQTALTAAQARHVQARWGYRAAQAALRRATGAAAWDNSSGN
jgi:outer membrane protein TolC